MKNKLKRYCIQSDSNGTIVNYLRERDIYFTAERVADLNYLSSHPAEPIMDESEFFRKYAAYILGFDEELKKEQHNFVEADAAEAAKAGTLKELVEKCFG